MAFDIMQHITTKIIAELEHGTIPWRKPWVSCGSCVSHVTLKPYSLLNTLILGKPGEYATFNQIKAEGGRVVKGAKSKMVVFWKPINTAKKDDQGNVILKPDGSPMVETFFILRYYSVFLVGEDTEGISLKHERKLPCAVKPHQKADQILSAYIAGSGVKLVHEKGDRAFYSPALNQITLPLKEQFTDTAAFYECWSHESVHSTMGPLGRYDETAFFGSTEYGKEELVAQIGASAILNYCGLETEKTIKNSASYCASWHQVLKNDKRFIVSAATKAQKAVELVLSYSPGETITADEPNEE